MTSGGSNQRLSSDRAAAQRVRESAFARIGRVRGATVIGAGALTAAIAGLVSAVAPGHTLGAKARPPATATSSRTTRAGTTALVMPPLDNPSQLGLQGPASPPQGTQPQPQVQTQTQSAPAPAPQSAPAPVVSGGS